MSLSSSIRSIPKLILTLALFGAFFVSFSSQAGDIEAGKVAFSQKGCIGCHGAKGITAIPTFPNLAGQNKAYLISALTQYKNGARTNPTMVPMAATVNKNEIENITSYLSSLK